MRKVRLTSVKEKVSVTVLLLYDMIPKHVDVSETCLNNLSKIWVFMLCGQEEKFLFQ